MPRLLGAAMTRDLADTVKGQEQHKFRKWRQGHKVPINVYQEDRPVCQCQNEQDAKAIVDAMNHEPAIRDLIAQATADALEAAAQKLLDMAKTRRDSKVDAEIILSIAAQEVRELQSADIAARGGKS
jgi:hypothetical protein